MARRPPLRCSREPHFQAGNDVMRKSWVCVLSAVQVFGPANHGQVARGADQQGSAGPEFIVPSATIIGMVRDPSGAPAPGIAVTFYPGQYPGAPEYAEAKTDDNGRYAVILQSKQ